MCQEEIKTYIEALEESKDRFDKEIQYKDERVCTFTRLSLGHFWASILLHSYFKILYTVVFFAIKLPIFTILEIPALKPAYLEVSFS